jgi:hypothetical protein
MMPAASPATVLSLHNIEAPFQAVHQPLRTGFLGHHGLSSRHFQPAHELEIFGTISTVPLMQ